MKNIILNDRYLLIDHIGGGGMADVYKAKDQRLERDVAVKILKDQFAGDSDFIESFKRESHAAARLNHPNIVSVYDVGSDDINGTNKYYIVMELINGYTLKDKIRENGKLEVDKAVEYALIISRALLNAHKNGIIHRDVKPQNILLQDNEEPKVTDFGIAQGATQATSTMASGDDILGSVHYFSPEQASGNKTDERSDIYSLGIVFYEMLTGELPFTGETPIAVALKHIQEEMPNPSDSNPEVSGQLDEIILKMTAKDPDDRYDNLEQVIEDLNNLENYGYDMDDTLLIPSGAIDPGKDQYNQENIQDESDLEESEDDQEEDVKDEKKKGGILPIILGVILALVIATFAFSNIIGNRGNEEVQLETVEVPQLIGVHVNEARNILAKDDIKLEVVGTDSNADYPVDSILSQDPLAGTEIEPGSVVNVTINTKAVEEDDKTVTVGNFVGMDYSQVSALVIEQGFVLGDAQYEEVDNSDDIGKVLAQDLRPGTVVAKGSVISFIVGKEAEDKTEMVTVPNLVGESLETAKSILNAYNLKYTVTEAESSRFRENTVMGQSISAGNEVEAGTTIELVVTIPPQTPEEESPEEETSQDTTRGNQAKRNQEISIEIPDIGEESVLVEIKEVNGNNTSTVYSGMHDPGEGQITNTIPVSEGSSYQIFIDGDLVGTYP